MPGGYQNRILELDRIKQNASEQLEKITIMISIIEAHLKNLHEKRNVGETLEKQEIAIDELKRQLVTMKSQSLIFRSQEIDALMRKKCLLRNQSKVQGGKAKLQVENRRVNSQREIEAQLKLLNLTKMGDEKENQKTPPIVERENDQVDESLEKRPIQYKKSYSFSLLAVGNNNVIVADNENKPKLPNLLQKESNLQSFLAYPANTVTAILSKADDENINSLIIPSPGGDNNREASDFVEDAECNNKSFQSNTSIISAKDEEFVPTFYPPKEEWENPLLWRQQPSFGNKKFTEIKTSPPIDWNERYKDAAATLSSRSRSQSEDHESLRGVTQKSHDRGMHCRGRPSNSRVKCLQEMDDFSMTMRDFKAEERENSNDSTNDSQREKSLSVELYQCVFTTKTKGLNKPARDFRGVGDKYQKWINQPRPNKNAPSANDRLCKKTDNNNILNSELKQNAVVKPDKIAEVRMAAEMRKMLEVVMYTPKLDLLLTPQSPAMPSSEVECICLRPLRMILCNSGYWFVGRVRTLCPIHPQDFYLLDVNKCRECKSFFLKEYDMTEGELGENYRNPLISSGK